jgi:putative endonuclease
MAEHNDLGKTGEELAADFLEENGYTLLERNWRFRQLEADLIALKDEFLIVAEVKTRMSNYFGEPEVFVDKKKQRHLVKTANAYVQMHQLDLEVRFDIVAITGQGKASKIHHIKDAFSFVGL